MKVAKIQQIDKYFKIVLDRSTIIEKIDIQYNPQIDILQIIFSFKDGYKVMLQAMEYELERFFDSENLYYNFIERTTKNAIEKYYLTLYDFECKKIFSKELFIKDFLSNEFKIGAKSRDNRI